MLIIWIPVFAHLENKLTKLPISTSEKKKVVEIVEEVVYRVVELIDDTYVQQGTIEKVKLLEAKINEDYDWSRFNNSYQRALDNSFDILRSNTEIFLDQYYSLTAEYIRISKMLQGELENHIKAQLEQALLNNNPFSELDEVLLKEKEKIQAFNKEKKLALEAIQMNLKIQKFNWLMEKLQIKRVIPKKLLPFLLDP